MQVSINVPEKDLIEFGSESIYREMKNTLKWMKIRSSFNKISMDSNRLFYLWHYKNKQK